MSNATEKLAVYVTPGSEVLEVITDKQGSLKEVYVLDGGPVITTVDVVEDLSRFNELEEKFNAAMDAAGEMDADCGCDD